MYVRTYLCMCMHTHICWIASRSLTDDPRPGGVPCSLRRGGAQVLCTQLLGTLALFRDARSGGPPELDFWHQAASRVALLGGDMTAFTVDRALEHERPPTPSQRQEDNQHKSSCIQGSRLSSKESLGARFQIFRTVIPVPESIRLQHPSCQ